MTNKRTFHNISRRRLLQVAAGGATLAVSGLAKPYLAQAKTTELLVSAGGGDWGTFLKKAYFDPYTAKTGTTISPQPFKGMAELKAMVEAQAWGQTDVILMSAGDAAIAEIHGLVEPIDYGVVDKADLLPGTVSEGWFLTDLAASVLTWNSDAVKAGAEPKDWVDFFNPENKAPRGLWKSASQTLDIAALGSGVPLDKLYPFDVEVALKTLSGIRDKIVWYDGGAQSQQMIVSGEIDMGMLWINRADALVVEGRSVKYRLTNTMMDGDAFVIPKGHPKKAAAMDFAVWLASPEPQAGLTNLVAMGPSNRKAIDLADPARVAKTVSNPKNFASNRLQDFKWWAENGERLNSEFNKWLLG